MNATSATDAPASGQAIAHFDIADPIQRAYRLEI